MCALFGFLNYGKRIPWRTLQKLVQALANASEVRGNHAAGIAYNSGGELYIYKRPKPAHKLHFRIPDGTTAVMGHTRMTTQGDQKFNYNNHPFRGHAGTGFALAHNGVLYNDRSLRSELHLPETQIETDSYIAVQLIESQQEMSFDSLRYTAEKVRGSFTFTLLDDADTIHIVKGDNPLYLLHFPKVGLYVYSSTQAIMHAALRAHCFHLGKYDVIPVSDGELLRIRPDGAVERGCFTMHDDLTYWPHWFGNSYNWGSFSESRSALKECDDEDWMILVELCSYYGVEPEDIRYLREMGYSFDEIEQMMTDPDAYGMELPCAEL